MRKQPQAAQNRGMKLRARIVAGFFVLVCFGVLGVHLWQIQITDYEFYAQRAAGQQLRDSIVPAPRGDIVDCNGVPLAVSATCWTVRAVPREMDDEDVKPASEALAQILELDPQEVYDKLNDRHSNDKLLRRRVEKEMADQVRAICAENDWQGIVLMENTKRWYPEGDFAASVLGFTNVDNRGVAGLELKYDEQLAGCDGRVLSAKNAWGYNMPTDYDTYIPPTQGNQLQLTIDVNIQHYLEKYLSYAVKEHNVSARGVGIVMEVDTGRILALSTKNDYDPNQPRVIQDDAAREYVEHLEGEEKASARQLAQQTQWRNKAVSDLYEPGSVFKVITCAAGLDAGVVTPESRFNCGKAYNVAGVAFHCANHKSHGNQSLAQALQNSCNQSFIQIGQKLGKEKFCEYFEKFGLCTATGIDLPAEPKKSEFYTADRMGPVELASCSFGQSSKITPIQVVTAISAVVNGGKLMQPYVVEKITDSEGDLVQQMKPVEKRQVITPETSAQMCEIMESVITSGGGKNAYIAGYRVGGKSGTSQKLDSPDEKARVASFVGVAPIDHPRIAVLVVLDEPHSFSTGGGALSAPVVARVIEDTLEYYDTPRQYTEEEQETLIGRLPDTNSQSVESAVQEMEQCGFASKVLGQGDHVVCQYPQADTVLPRGSTVILYTDEQAAQVVTTVPGLVGQSVEKVCTAMTQAGLNVQVQGPADSANAVVVQQSEPAGSILPQGSLVTVHVCDFNLPQDGDAPDD